MKAIKKLGAKTSGLILCGRSLEVFLDEIESFHGFVPPGLVLGGFLVDWAQELVGVEVEADAIVETYRCLPDAVQIFTPCTIGNGWLKVLNWHKFALTLYDKRELLGYRVWLDLEKAKMFPPVYNWYMRGLPKKDLPLEVLVETSLEAGRSVLSCRAIRVTRFYGREKKGDIKVCQGCGEAYPAVQGDQCSACQGQGYYELRE